MRNREGPSLQEEIGKRRSPLGLEKELEASTCCKLNVFSNLGVVSVKSILPNRVLSSAIALAALEAAISEDIDLARSRSLEVVKCSEIEFLSLPHLRGEPDSGGVLKMVSVSFPLVVEAELNEEEGVSGGVRMIEARRGEQLLLLCLILKAE